MKQYAILKDKGKGNHGGTNPIVKENILLLTEKRLSKYTNDAGFLTELDVPQTVEQLTVAGADETAPLTYYSYATNFPVLTKFYPATPKTINLSVGDATFGRVDLILANKPDTVGGMGYITKSEGTPSLNYTPNNIDLNTQYIIKWIYVAPNATVGIDVTPPPITFEYSIDIVANFLKLYRGGIEVGSKDLSIYLDDTNLARLTSGVLNSTTGIVTFTRDDASTFTLDLSNLLDNQTASEVSVDSAAFTGNLAVTDNTVQKVAEKVDALVLGTGSSSVTIERTTSAEIWPFIHNLNNPYPNITVWNLIGEVISPKKIESIDANNLNIIFPIALQGYATAVGNVFTPTPPLSYDVNAQLFIDAVPTLDLINKNAINQLVLDLKSYGLWTKLISINPKAGATASEHKWNLKDPRDLDVAYRHIYTGGWVHSALGIKSNITDTLANTFLNPSALGLTGNIAMGVYVTQAFENFGDKYLMGGHSGINNFFAIQKGGDTTLTAIAYSSGAIAKTVPSNAKGFYAVSVVGATKRSHYETTVLEEVSVNGTGVPNVPIYEGCLNLGGKYGNLTFGAGTSFIGNGLTSVEMTNLRTAILTYETALGRN